MATQTNHFQVNRLPRRFPVGTRFVIEGRGGRILLQYLEFPDGRHIDLPAGSAKRMSGRRPHQARGSGQKTGARKF